MCTEIEELGDYAGSVSETSVLALREIEKDRHELRVSNLPVQIQDDSLRTG